MVADYHGVSIQQKVRPKSERVQPKVSADRFKVLMSAFKGWVPADVSDAVSLRQADPWLFVVAPGVHVGALMGKEAPWRAAVLEAWQNTPDRQRWQIAGLHPKTRHCRQQERRLCLRFSPGALTHGPNSWARVYTLVFHGSSGRSMCPGMYMFISVCVHWPCTKACSRSNRIMQGHLASRWKAHKSRTRSAVSLRASMCHP